MSQLQNNKLLVPLERDFIRTVETNMEKFTKMQTIIIEKWSKAEAKSKEEKKSNETYQQIKKEIEEIPYPEKTILKIELFDRGYHCTISKHPSIDETKDHIQILKKHMNHLKLVGQNLGVSEKEEVEKLLSLCQNKSEALESEIKEFDIVKINGNNLLNILKKVDVDDVNLFSSQNNEISLKEYEEKMDASKKKYKTLRQDIEVILNLCKQLGTYPYYEESLENLKETIENKMNNFKKKWAENFNDLKNKLAFSKIKQMAKKITDEVDLLLLDDKLDLKSMLNQIEVLQSKVDHSQNYAVSQRALLTNYHEEINFIIENLLNLNKKLNEKEKIINMQLQNQDTFMNFCKGLNQLLQSFDNQLNVWSKVVDNLSRQFSTSKELNELLKRVENVMKDIKDYNIEIKERHEEIKSNIRGLDVDDCPNKNDFKKTEKEIKKMRGQQTAV